MIKIFNKVKSNILLYDLFFIGITVLINFLLYLVNIRLRLWGIGLLFLISTIGFIIGLFQLLANQKKYIIIIILLIVALNLLFLPIVGPILIFSYKPEHTTTLDGKKYVAVVSSFLHVDVDYYDYYGFLLMGTKVKVHGYFGRGGYDPFANPGISDGATYTYYDSNGKIKSERVEVFIKDKNKKIIDKINYDIDIDKNSKFDDNANYVLPENENVLYEKKFGKTILRFGKVDDVLGQNMLINVLRSKDNGNNFYVVSDDVIQVSKKAKFEFLSKDLGFVINTGKIYLDDKKTSLYVTDNGGKNFIVANFDYKNENVEYLIIENMPYYDKDILKLQCSLYEVSDDGHENKELVFISKDNGFNWKVEDN